MCAPTPSASLPGSAGSRPASPLNRARAPGWCWSGNPMPAGASWETRRSVLTAWYRKELRQEAAGLMEHWQRRRGVPMNRLLVEAMSRPWGSGDRACHTCIVQHEPAHLRVPARAEELVAMLDSLQPDWAERRRPLCTLA